ncbi:MAG TPA: anthrone oxygenase family protein [Actinomycetes bacterium]|nr:anthrone oxygenase family protein [Actinomycetes bacterium]
MIRVWAITMLISGGLFAGGVVWIAWERVPAWLAADFPEFLSTFAHTLRRVDRLQPALLVIFTVSTVGFAPGDGGSSRTPALVAAGAALVIMTGSVAWLVPLQRRMVACDAGQPPPDGAELRAQWVRGHSIRAIVSVLALALSAAAAVA